MIDLGAARKLIDLQGKLSGGFSAEDQLQGAVAAHNMLERQGVAYVADEVGLGKTYVALATVALMRHYKPDLRVLYILPKENLQRKWINETRKFARNNVRFQDLRVRGIDDRPVQQLVHCNNLRELMEEAVLDPDRDFYVRLSSFSIAHQHNKDQAAEQWRLYRQAIARHLPWMEERGLLSLRSKEEFKDTFAIALNLLLPRFDLVVVDEGHNLKHGFGDAVATRNRVLGLAMGRDPSLVDRSVFKHYGPRAQKVLFLSATPLEGSYTQLWNQLDLFGKGQRFRGLTGDGTEEEKQAEARKFLIRRVNRMKFAGQEHTKNQYRREWRNGGVQCFDEPMRVENDRQRLVVALVQKKVSELLGDPKFNKRFQIGMLASFESFLQTAKLGEDQGTFDDAEQTQDHLEREGIDVHQLNRLARDYRHVFDQELPHPKMEALVDRLADLWRSGEKALVFVRRVHSVTELKNKLDDRYDAWILETLCARLDPALHKPLKAQYSRYREQKGEFLRKQRHILNSEDPKSAADADKGGFDTFFAWYFRGEARTEVNAVTGASIQQRFTDPASVYYTFFEDNHAALALDCAPEEVAARFCALTGLEPNALRESLRHRSQRFYSDAKTILRGHRFRAVQGAAIEWLKELKGPAAQRAHAIWNLHYHAISPSKRPLRVVPDIGHWLQARTFFTELRRRPVLRESLWPAGVVDRGFMEQYLLTQLLARTARLGHASIDLFAYVVNRIGTLVAGRQEQVEDDVQAELDRVNGYLDLLEKQQATAVQAGGWCAYHELEALAGHYDLIIATNLPELQDARNLAEHGVVQKLTSLFSYQQPVGGMAGRVNRRLVQQFRMPGYPFALITTDLLQEGEDLHTFCSEVYHYGISWTPSSMEQRIGRIDRVGSRSERRLTPHSAPPPEEHKLQVFYPHLKDTVEVLQVRNVLDRMNTFLRMMHKGLDAKVSADRSVHIDKELQQWERQIEQITEHLRSAFPVQATDLRGDRDKLDVEPSSAMFLIDRFKALNKLTQYTWEPPSQKQVLLGTAKLQERVQPFSLMLIGLAGHAVVRCISPIGLVRSRQRVAEITDQARRSSVKIGAVQGRDGWSYDLTAEGEVMLGAEPAHDAARVTQLIDRVVQQADQLEATLLDRDERMDVFRLDLERESDHG